MNEEELRDLWQNADGTPEINVAGLQKLSDDSYKKLRRRARMDLWAQWLATAACFIPVFFYPRLIWAALLALILCVLYVRELSLVSNDKSVEPATVSIRDTIKNKIKYLKRFFWRTRLAVYIFTALILIATFYGLGYFDDPSVSFQRRMIWVAKLVAIAEILAIIGCEIYSVILYGSAFRELKEISMQLDADAN